MDLEKKACEIQISKKFYDAKEQLKKNKGKELCITEINCLCMESGLKYQDIINKNGKYYMVYYLDINKNDCKKLYDYYNNLEEKAIKLIINKIDDKINRFIIEEIEIP